MAQKEKLKAYDEALEQARRFHKAFVSGYDYSAADIKAPYEAIFPELKESEDERIRKAIGYAIGQSTHSDGTLINGVSSEEALAWLEKQVSPILSNSSSIGKNFNYENANIQQKDFAPKPQRIVAAEAKEALYDKPEVSKETIRLIIELFISWNGETEAIDIANLSTAVEYINEYINEN